MLEITHKRKVFTAGSYSRSAS